MNNQNKVVAGIISLLAALPLTAGVPEDCVDDPTGTGAVCCTGQTPLINPLVGPPSGNNCVQKTCAGGTQYDENPCPPGVSYDSCNPTTVEVTITVTQMPILYNRVTHLYSCGITGGTPLPSETAYCIVQEKVNSCD
jgi:hypothetical protein